MKFIIDLNQDGVSDLQQPWFWQKVLEVAMALLMRAPAHTVAGRIGRAYDQEVRPELDKVLR